MSTTTQDILFFRKSSGRFFVFDLLYIIEKRSLKTLLSVLLIFCTSYYSQCYNNFQQKDSLYNITAAEKQRIIDSVQRSQVENLLNKLNSESNDVHRKDSHQQQLDIINTAAEVKLTAKKAYVDSLRPTTKGYPVLGVKNDTLFMIYSKIGASTPKNRASEVSRRIKKMYADDFFDTDSITIVESESEFDIAYGNNIIMSVSDYDAIWYKTTKKELAETFKKTIKNSILSVKEEREISKILVRLVLALVTIGVFWFIIRLLKKGHDLMLVRIESKKEIWLKNLNYKDYTFLSSEQELQVVFFILKLIRWGIISLLLYIALPIVFSIFPISRHWADILFQFIWSPFKKIIFSVWDYLPNLFRILVIYFVMKYVIKAIRYIFQEIKAEKLKLSGFHHDWAAPTFSIIKFLLYAFMFVIIFPLLPGSDSNIFKGVSVFIGVLLSFGSSSAIANTIAGLVITYMRPFKIGDRIKIAEVSGDVTEKSLLVTRIITPKNEIITIPNASVLSGNVINYSREAQRQGLILYKTITIGYDAPWKDVHQALIDAALMSTLVLKEPKPFVYQTSLDDFYVAYQINLYTREASKQDQIYSELHQNIQNVFNERGIEILSPHYNAQRDGNATSIPSNYLPKDYKAPSFNIKFNKEE